MRSDTAVSVTRQTTMSESGSNSDVEALHATLQEVLGELAKLAQRVSGLEELTAISGGETASAAISLPVEAPISAAPPATSSVAAAAGISEEEVLAISAALAAWLGVHAHIRQIRLIRTGAWALQGRVTIQTSHRLYH
jgi:methylmalonyl-CoA carboxyltransferase large subunit